MLRPGLAINHALNGAQRFAQAAGLKRVTDHDLRGSTDPSRGEPSSQTRDRRVIESGQQKIDVDVMVTCDLK